MTISNRIRIGISNLQPQLVDFKKALVVTFCPPDIVINEIKCTINDIFFTDEEFRISDKQQPLVIPLTSFNVVNDFNVRDSSVFMLYQDRIDADLLQEMYKYTHAIVLQTKNKSRMQILIALNK